MFTKFETIYFSDFIILERVGEKIIIFEEGKECKKILLSTLTKNKYSCFDDLYNISKSKGFNAADYLVKLLKGNDYE